jgi:transcriptional regulator with XRE-family HTH domain
VLRTFIPGFNIGAQYLKQLNNCRSWAVGKSSRKTFAPNCTKSEKCELLVLSRIISTSLAQLVRVIAVLHEIEVSKIFKNHQFFWSIIMGNSSLYQIETKKLGDLIQDARVTLNKRAEDCATAMGIALPDYELYEEGDKAPSLPELEALGYYLDIPIDHFLENEENFVETKENISIGNINHLIPLRHRIIGILMRKARLEANITTEELAQQSEIEQEKLTAYEIGSTPIPVPELDVIAQALNISIRDFRDKDGPIGKWAVQKKAIEDFKELPTELQIFVSRPVNLPYLELAQRLSEMSVDKLRAVAEGLLEITL